MADATTSVTVPLTVAEVDAISVDDFVAVFGGVLEDSPQLAAAVAARRPFRSADEVADAFDAVVDGLDRDAALALLRAHPELGARRPMAAASVQEQAAAGISDAADPLRERLATGNAEYRRRFGFPFIVAVRGRGPDEILDELTTRLARDPDTEFATALDQVRRIARLRVGQLVRDPGADR